jgi:predicted acyl esterase
MRDGAVLRSDVYRPAAVDEPLPVLLTRHPYGKNAHTPDKAYFDPMRVAQAGYIVVIQDVRGRFASDGELNPDTDFVARLVDVFPDGRKLCVTDGIIRCRARETFRPGGQIRRVSPTLVQPGQPYEHTIDLWATARTFLAGHRMRVEITSSSFPRWDRNLNTGRDPYVDAEPQRAEQTISHSPALPSHIVLPVYHGVL